MVFCCFGCVLKKVSGCWFLALLEAAAAIKIRDQIGESLNSSRILEGTLLKEVSGCWVLALL